ncbi:hypothetical protein [Moorena sp. SIO3F7]|uniref:hypothetical protein n=2 Tax=unclassified Moorena TaxID=2683338 RepID=UPI0013FE93EA|nr:hypothetical protein [Moorena sp. SIO3F7]NEQ04339.1 hypothetical protein [Moorena sp. SIO3F7]
MSRFQFLASAIYVLAFLLLIAVFAVGSVYEIPFHYFTADPAYTHKFHPFTGILSNIGIILWCVSLTCCCFSSVVIWKSQKMESRFLLLSGMVTAILLLDDFFMFHDYVLIYFFSKYFSVQPVVYLLYGVIMVIWGLRFLKLFKKTKYYFLVLAVFFFAGSILLDIILPSAGLQYFFEDSFKFLGIVSWTIYFSVTSFEFIKPKPESPNIGNG